jgi:NAD(P)-dependent dehydrogenase (short-subunit alcohol dehydrogenase family)
MSATLSGKAFLVTGGSMGIGLACVEELLAQGGNVVVMARGQQDLDASVGVLRHRHKHAVRGYSGDVTDETDVRSALEAVGASFGRLDGVVHSAGIYGPIGPVVKVSPDEWLNAIRVNLFGSFLVARAAAQMMLQAKHPGSIALMSGGGAATPFPNYTGYACGKAGVVRLTETMAIELADSGIRVNCIAPGFVATRLHQQTLEAGSELAGSFVENTKAQLAKGGVPPTVAAKAAAFLMGDASAKITGRFLAAPYDEYLKWPERAGEIAGSDFFTLRRIVPRDRGKDWQ